MSSALWWVTNGRAAAPPCEGLHHRRFDFEVAAVAHVLRGSRRRSRMRSFSSLHHLGVGPEVDVALAVAQLDVARGLPTSPGGGSRALPAIVDVGRPDRDFAFLGRAELAFDDDLVAEVDQVVDLPVASRRGASCRGRPAGRRVSSRSVRKLSFPMSRLRTTRPAPFTSGPPSWPISGGELGFDGARGVRPSVRPPYGSMPRFAQLQ